MTKRELEKGIVTDHSGRVTYGDYLCLDRLMTCQQPKSDPPHHDEMLFIIQHQTSELWLKLIVHELTAAIRFVNADQLDSSSKVLARVKHIQRQLFNQWTVLATLTPSEYTQFREVLGTSSGFQSVQYRMVEFLMGNKDRRMVEMQQHDPAAHAQLTARLEAPSIYDAFLGYLARVGFELAPEVLERDLSEPHVAHDSVTEALLEVYQHPEKHWGAYELAEKLVDVEEQFSLWRYRHMKTVQRIIGSKMGTGGSSGVSFLRKVVDHVFFPELWDVRTRL